MRSGAVRLGVLLVLAALAALITMPSGRADEPGQPHDSAALLAEIGLTPEALAIAGVSAAHAEEMAARLQAAESFRAQYAAARSGLQSDSAALTLLRERRFHAVEGVDSSGVASAAGAVNASRANVETLAGHLFVLETADLDSAGRELLEVCRRGPASGLPPEFWPLALSGHDLSSLREALVAERRAARRGEVIAAEAAELLAEHREDARVVSALAALENAADIRAALHP